MDTQFDKPSFIADEFGSVQDVRGRGRVPVPMSPVGGVPNGPSSPGNGDASKAARPSRGPASGVRWVPIPIGLVISLFLYLISSIGNGDSRRAVNRFNEANGYFESGSFEQAIAKYEEAIERKPSFPEAYYNRGLAYAALEDNDQAIADWNQALRLMPGLLRAYVSRGTAYYMQGETDKAIADYDEAIERASRYSLASWSPTAEPGFDGLPGFLQDSAYAIDLPEVYAYRGLAYLEKGQVDRALVDLDKAIELRPTLTVAYYVRGVAYCQMGRYEQGIADLLMVLELDSDPDLSRDAGALLEELGIEREAGLSS